MHRTRPKSYSGDGTRARRVAWHLLLLVSAMMIMATMVSAAEPVDPVEGEEGEDHTETEERILIEDIVQWVRSRGGYISEKVEVRQIYGALSGIFATQNIEKDEIVVEIPWDLILKPNPKDERNYCAIVESLKQALSPYTTNNRNSNDIKNNIKNIIKNIIKNNKEGNDDGDENPYEWYLVKRPKRITPYYFTNNLSKILLMQLMNDFDLSGFHSNLEYDYLALCHQHYYQTKVPTIDDDHVHAMMILQTRGEGKSIDLLVPFGDLFNHRNGDHTNVHPAIESGKQYRMVTTRAVQAGEQLQCSYNQCQWCKGLYSNPSTPRGFIVTPQMFEFYGFVELLPQRWIVPDARLLFDIDTNDDNSSDHTSATGNLSPKVTFVAPPSKQGLDYLRDRLQTFTEFDKKNRNRDDIPSKELKLIFEFHTAIVQAYSLALEQASQDDQHISNEVWTKDEHDWHKERDDEDGNVDEEEDRTCNQSDNRRIVF